MLLTIQLDMNEYLFECYYSNIDSVCLGIPSLCENCSVTTVI